MKKIDAEKMLGEIVEEIDYDLYKDIFFDDDTEDAVSLMMDIVGKYIEIEGD